jgi:hypothetical protein
MADRLSRGFRSGVVVTPSDDYPQPQLITAFMVSANGNVAIQSRGNPGKAVYACIVGVVYEIEAEWVYATGTSGITITTLVKG